MSNNNKTTKQQTNKSLLRKPHLAGQPVEYAGISKGKIHPMDLDGLLEFDSKDLVIMEFKQQGKPFDTMNKGQKRALEALANNWTKSDTAVNHSAILYVEHKAKETDEVILARESVVTYAYHPQAGMWNKLKSALPLKEALNKLGEYWNQPRLAF